MNFLPEIVNLLPDIGLSIGLFGAFEGVFRFLKSKRTQKYIESVGQILTIVDDLLADHPEYDSSKIESVIDSTIKISQDGKIGWGDFRTIKKLVIELYDPRRSGKKRVTGHDEKIKKTVEEIVG